MCGIAGWFDNEIDHKLLAREVLTKTGFTLIKVVLCCTDGLLLLTKKTANSLWRHDTEEKHI